MSRGKIKKRVWEGGRGREKGNKRLKRTDEGKRERKMEGERDSGEGEGRRQSGGERG